jgi:hypothetical protein
LEDRCPAVVEDSTNSAAKAKELPLAAIYVRLLPEQINVKTFPNPVDVKGNFSFLPPHTTSRIAVQSGVLKVHEKPNKDWDDEGTKVILLDFNRENSLDATRRPLRFGIHKYALFLDLDGLSGYLRFRYNRGFSLRLAKMATAAEETTTK